MRTSLFAGLSAVLLVACGSDGSSGESGGCPGDRPSNNSSCDSENKVCEYEELDGSNLGCDDLAVTAFRCEGGVWVDHGAECNCPSELPANGSDCIDYQDTHDCDGYCGGNGPVAQCGSETDYLWEVSGSCP